MADFRLYDPVGDAAASGGTGIQGNTGISGLGSTGLQGSTGVGGGGAGSLAATLAIGNTTGGNPIILTGTDIVKGVDGATPTGATLRGGDAASGSVEPGGNLALRAGDGDQVGFGGGSGGTIIMRSGSPDPGATEAAGDIVIDIPSGYFGGSINIAVADGGPGGDGSISLAGPSIYLEPNVTSGDQILRIGGASTNIIGFYGVGGITQPTITGSRGGNAALADLLTQLASMGIIVDGTSA